MNFINEILVRIQNMRRRERQTWLFMLVGIIGLSLISLALFMFLGGKQMKTFESRAYGLSIKYPSAWEVKTNLPGVVAGFVTPREGSLDIFQENVTVIIQDLTNRPLTLRQYAQTAEIQIKSLFKDQIVVEYSGPILIAGMTGHKLVYRGVNQDNPTLNLKAVHIMCMKNEQAYQLSYTALVSQFDKYEEAFNRMASSFSIE